jgi:hypothetical protein
MVAFGSDVDCRSSDNSCLKFTLELSDNYNPVCDYTCSLWAAGVAGITVDEARCETVCRNQQWTWNYAGKCSIC